MNILDLPSELIARIASECPRTSAALSAVNREAHAVTSDTRAAQKCARRCANAWKAKTSLKYISPIRKAFAAVRRVRGGASQDELASAGLNPLDLNPLFEAWGMVWDVNRDGGYVTTLSMLVVLEEESIYAEVNVTKAATYQERVEEKAMTMDEDSLIAILNHLENQNASCALLDELRQLPNVTAWEATVELNEEGHLSYPTARTPNCFAESAVAFAKSALESIAIAV
jgi:hypothetical protein